MLPFSKVTRRPPELVLPSNGGAGEGVQCEGQGAAVLTGSALRGPTGTKTTPGLGVGVGIFFKNKK